MAVTRPSPAWVFGAYVASLVLVFVGERVLAVTPAAHWVATGLGLAGIVATLGFRFSRVRKATGSARTTERSFAVFSSVGAFALFLYFVTQDPLASVFGLSSMAPASRDRVETLLRNVWLATLLLSTLPQLFGQLALEPMRLAEHPEWKRVRGALESGLVVAMACVSAALFTYSAGELGLRADFSYFRTARPSDSTVNTAQAMTQPLRVVTFFPPVSEVRTEVHGYLRDLARRTKTVTIEEADRLASPKMARDLGVTQDGMVVLERGGEHQTLTFPLVLHDARAKLKTIDADFEKALVKVVKNRKKVYLTIGHGELNDSQSSAETGRTAAGFKELLERFNYQVGDLGLAQGLGREIPDDATVVAVLGPTEPVSEQELLSLGRFAARGGHLLLALEPAGKSNGERLAGLFGVKWNRTVLCDDRTFAARRMNDSDHSIILTNRFSSHASVATLSRLGSRAVFFLGTGYLEAVSGPGTAPDFIVRSLPSTFNDMNGNFKFDPSEERATYNLAAAISRAATEPAGKDAKTDSSETRAIIIADSDVVSDAALMNASLANGNPQFLADVLKWLGGEESSIGALADTGEDVRIEHTKQQDSLLFYATIFGAPLVVLAFGLLYTRRLRHRLARRPA